MHRILYLGQKWLGEMCFDNLQSRQNRSLRICAAVSNQGKDVWWGTNKIWEGCAVDGIPCLDNSVRNNEAIANLVAELGINTILSVQHPWIIPGQILELVGYNAYNLHNAKLPDYKGHNACNHAILNGELYYTSTVHWLAPEVDSGAIAFEETIEIAPDETARSLYARALCSGGIIFRRLVDHLCHGLEIPRRAIVGEGFFYPRTSLDSLREIKNALDPSEVERKARALFFPPFEPAYHLLSGRKCYVLPEGFHIYASEIRSYWL